MKTLKTLLFVLLGMLAIPTAGAATYTFTVNVDDASKIVSFTERTGNKADLKSQIQNGTNTITASSNRFYVTVTEEAAEFTVDDVAQTYTAASKRYAPTIGNKAVVNIVFARESNYTLITDSPESILSITGAEGVEFGYNTLSANGSAVTVATAGTPLELSVNGTAIEGVDGVYTFTPAADDVVRAFFKYVPGAGELCKVSTNFVNPGTEDFFSDVYLYGNGDENLGYISDMSIFQGGILLNKGIELNVHYDRFGFFIDDIRYNSTEVTSRTGAFTFTLLADTEISCTVTRPESIDYSIVVADPTAIVAYNGTWRTPENTLDLIEKAPAANCFHTTSLNPILSIEPNADKMVLINSVADNMGHEYKAENGTYTIELADGMEITVDTEDVTLDETLVICINGNFDLGLDDGAPVSENVATLSCKSGSHNLKAGRNVVNFNSRYDDPLMLSYKTTIELEKMQNYLNGTELAWGDDPYSLMGILLFEAKDGDILHSYYNLYNSAAEEEEEGVEAKPQVCEVEFTVAEGAYDGEGHARFAIYREACQAVSTDAAVGELTGTTYHIYGSNDPENGIVVEWIPEGTEPGPAEAPAREGAVLEGGVPETLDGLPHIAAVTITGPGTLSIKTREATDIDGISIAIGDAHPTAIYNLQGVKVSGNLNSIPAGVYIMDGRKVMVK